MGDAIGQIIERYFRDPGPETLRAVRDEIAVGGNYDPELSPDRAAAPYDGGDDEALVDRLLALMPGALLSPHTHRLLGDAYERLGQDASARREHTLADVAVRALLRSGDGSRERPWTVLRTSDQQDVLAELGRVTRYRRFVEDGDRLLDAHVCDDGRELWFDVSLLREPAPAGVMQG